MYVVVIGNCYRIVGPFNHISDAARWMREHDLEWSEYTMQTERLTRP